MDKDDNKTKKTSGAGCLTVFGGVFLLAGLGVLGLAAKTMLSFIDAKGWAAADATVLSANLERKSDNDGGTTYKVVGKYRYQWQGQFYESDRIAHSTGSDNVGSFHQDTYRELDRHRKSGHPLTVWVDPDEPAQAIAFRQMRWGHFSFLMLFATVFSGVGGGIIAAGHYGAKIIKREAAREAQFPGEPWRWRDMWQNPTLVSQQKSKLWFSIGFAVFWNLISSPLLFVIPGEVTDKGNWLALVGLLFPIVGVGLIVYAIRTWQQWRQFGQSTFEMTAIPAKLGGRLRGVLVSAGTLPQGPELVVTLSCINKVTRGSGKNRSTSEKIRWQDEQRLPLPAGTSVAGLRVPIEFILPTDERESDWADGDDVILWRLEANADIPGVDYGATFELPVFGVAENPESATSTEYRSTGSHTDNGDLLRTGVVTEMTANGQRYYFPPARHRSIAATLFIMTLVFGGAGVGIVLSGSPIFGGIFVFFGALMALSTLHTLLHRSEVVTTSRALQHSKGWFGLGQEQRLPRDQISRIAISSSMSAGNKRYYDVVAHTAAGKHVKLANSLAGKRDTRQLALKIGKELGLQPHQLPN